MAVAVSSMESAWVITTLMAPDTSWSMALVSARISLCSLRRLRRCSASCWAALWRTFSALPRKTSMAWASRPISSLRSRPGMSTDRSPSAMRAVMSVTRATGSTIWRSKAISTTTTKARDSTADAPCSQAWLRTAFSNWSRSSNKVVADWATPPCDSSTRDSVRVCRPRAAPSKSSFRRKPPWMSLPAKAWAMARPDSRNGSKARATPSRVRLASARPRAWVISWLACR